MRNPHGAPGFTLLEILMASVLSVLLLGVLAMAISGVSSSHQEGTGRVQAVTELRSALEIMRRDLASSYGGRSSGTSLREAVAAPPVEGAPQAGDIEGAVDPKLRFLQGRIVLPFEVNRENGAIFDPGNGNPQAARRGIANAFSVNGASNHPNFDTLAFVSRAPLTRQSHTSIDRSASFRNLALAEDSPFRSDGDACLVGYYGAYTKNAPVADAPSSMKLFRHFKDSGYQKNRTPTGQRSQDRSFHILAEVIQRSRVVMQEGRFDNADLPLVLTPVKTYGDNRLVHPWPLYPVGTRGQIDYSSLNKPPPNVGRGRGVNSSDRLRGGEVQADEPLVHNILKFKCTPLRRLLDPATGRERMVGAVELNEAYGLNASSPEEWPVVFVPHAIRIEMLVVDDEIAAKLLDKRDWHTWENKEALRSLVTSGSYELETVIRIGQDG